MHTVNSELSGQVAFQILSDPTRIMRVYCLVSFDSLGRPGALTDRYAAF